MDFAVGGGCEGGETEAGLDGDGAVGSGDGVRVFLAVVVVEGPVHGFDGLE